MTSASTYHVTTNTPKFGGRNRHTRRPTIKYDESYLQWLSRECPEIIIEYYNNLRKNKRPCFCDDGLGNITCEDCEYRDSESEPETEPETEPELETQARRVRSMAPSPEPVPETQPEVSYNYEYHYTEGMEDTGEYWYEEWEEWS